MITVIFWLSEAGPEPGPSFLAYVLWWTVFLVGLGVACAALSLLVFGWRRFNWQERRQLMIIALLL